MIQSTNGFVKCRTAVNSLILHLTASTKVLNNNPSNPLPQCLHSRKNSWCPAIPYERRPPFPFRFWFHALVWFKGLVCLSAAGDVWGRMPTPDTTENCLESNTGLFYWKTHNLHIVHQNGAQTNTWQSSQRLINKHKYVTSGPKMAIIPLPCTTAKLTITCQYCEANAVAIAAQSVNAAPIRCTLQYPITCISIVRNGPGKYM